MQYFSAVRLVQRFGGYFRKKSWGANNSTLGQDSVIMEIMEQNVRTSVRPEGRRLIMLEFVITNMITMLTFGVYNFSGSRPGLTFILSVLKH